MTDQTQENSADSTQVRVDCALGTWMPIATAPKDESISFLVLMGGNSSATYLVVQVSNFEGNLYPDQLDCNVDWNDRVTRATHWMPLPAPPEST